MKYSEKLIEEVKDVVSDNIEILLTDKQAIECINEVPDVIKWGANDTECREKLCNFIGIKITGMKCPTYGDGDEYHEKYYKKYPNLQNQKDINQKNKNKNMKEELFRFFKDGREGKIVRDVYMCDLPNNRAIYCDFSSIIESNSWFPVLSPYALLIFHAGEIEDKYTHECISKSLVQNYELLTNEMLDFYYSSLTRFDDGIHYKSITDCMVSHFEIERLKPQIKEFVFKFFKDNPEYKYCSVAPLDKIK